MSVMAVAQPAVVLLSGGLDSATTLAKTQRRGHECYARCPWPMASDIRRSLMPRQGVAAALGAREHRVMHVDLADIGGSALTDPNMPLTPETPTSGIPITCVPARNTMMLSQALGWAEVLGASSIYIGVNAVDYSGYPDCRPEFIAAFEALAVLATRAGVEGRPLSIQAPLIALTKAQIIRAGTQLGVDYALTVSCYQADSGGRACGKCDSCRIRRDGFHAAGVPDPTRYR